MLEDDSDHKSILTAPPLAKARRDVQVTRTPTKKVAMHCDGDSDKSDEGECKASSTDVTDDEERDDGEDAGDCDAAESRQVSDHEG